MNDLDTKNILDGIRATTELAKAARGLIKELDLLTKKIPWRSIARALRWTCGKFLEALRESVRFPEPPRFAIFCLKFSATVASYFLAALCLALLIADVGLLCQIPLAAMKRVEAIAVLIFMLWLVVAAFAQAAWLRVLLARDSRVLWGQRPQIKR